MRSGKVLGLVRIPCSSKSPTCMPAAGRGENCQGIETLLMDRLLRATVNTWNGLKSAIRTEAAFRQEIAVLLVAIPLAFVIGQNSWMRLALIGAVVFVMVVELLNTAIE